MDIVTNYTGLIHIMSKYNHLENYEWFGHFYTPDEEIEFPGKLSYSPEDGVVLEFMCPMKFIKPHSYIHGLLSNNEPCTLFGEFDSNKFGFRIGKYSIFQGKIKFDSVMFGDHFSNYDKFTGFIVDFTNFQEFCCPEILRNSIEYSDTPLLEHPTDSLDIRLVNQGLFDHVQNDYSNIFHCKNEKVVNKIKEFFINLENDFPDEKILVRKEIEWFIEILFKSSSSIETIRQQIHSFENLLSLLIYKPVIRNILSIGKMNDNEKIHYFPYLTSIFGLNKNRINLIKHKIIHYHMPINLKNIDFKYVIKNWMNLEDGFLLFSSMILSEDRKIHHHEILSGIILLLTMLESISDEINAERKDKYTAPFNKFDKTKIINKLKRYLSAQTNEEIGILLSDLRAEIVHIGKRRKILSKLSNGELLNIFLCLKVSVASYIYETLGIPSENIKKFQERNLPLD